MTEGRRQSGRADEPRLPRRSVVDPELLNPERRRANQLPEGEDQPGPVVVELNLLHELGLVGAEARLLELLAALLGTRPERADPLRISEGYWRCDLSVRETRRLVGLDREIGRARRASTTSGRIIWSGA
jgi:hypothetical protein